MKKEDVEKSLAYFSALGEQWDRIKEINQQIPFPMKEEAEVSVVIPAYNEEHQIIRLLKELRDQVFVELDDVRPEQFEVILVNNNSTDQTGLVANQFIQTERIPFPIYVIQVQFEEEERGVGTARKLGGDLAIWRSLNRNQDAKKQFYIASLDVDNSVPKEHFYKIGKTIRKSGADVLIGNTAFDVTIFHPQSQIAGIAKSVLEYRKEIYREALSINMMTNQNNVLSVSFYIGVGGFPKWRMADDIYLTIKAEKLKYQLALLDSDVILSQRNFAQNPFEVLTREVWDRNRWEAEAEERRKLERADGEYEYSDDYIKKCLTTFLDDMISQTLYMTTEKSYEQNLYEQRMRFTQIARANGVKEELLPDFTLYNVGKYSIEVVRGFLEEERRNQFLVQEQKDAVFFTKDKKMLLTGEAVLAKTIADCPMPALLTYLVEKDSLEFVVKRAEEQRYGLFRLVYLNKLKYFQKVEFKSEPIENLTGDKSLYLIRMNEKGVPYISTRDSREIPYYLKNYSKIILYEKIGDKCKIFQNDTFQVPSQLLEQSQCVQGINATGNVISVIYSMYANGKNSKKRNMWLTGLSLTEKEQFEDLYNGMIQQYTAYLNQCLTELEHENEEVQKQKITEMLRECFGIYTSRKERKAYQKNQNLLIQMIPKEQAEREKELEAIVRTNIC